jgi:uncharacterized protein YigE (DUF2233 family)
MEEVAQAIAEDQAKAAAQAQQPQASAAPDLNISDLAALKSIVEISSQRGTFKAGELEAVGKIYNKLSTFLEAVTKQKEA